MRYAVLVLTILGGLSAGFLGYRWMTDYHQVKGDMDAALQTVKALGELGLSDPKLQEAQAVEGDLRKFYYASYLLLAAVPLGLGGGLLAMARKRFLPTVLILLPVLAAGALQWRSLVFSSPLLLAGVLALFVGPREQPAEMPA